MEKLTPEQITTRLDHVLPRVEKAPRYTGGEWNSVVKDWQRPVTSRVALAFPDTYELGMSNLGLAILYDIVNAQPDMLAERVYCPWIDMERQMRETRIPLYGLETRHELRDFDLIGFSLPYEQLFTNALTMLDLAHIPLRWSARSADDPLILAGGSACYNPEPVYAFFDAFLIGEGEEAILQIARLHAAWRDEGGRDRHELWRRLAQVEGVYVPALYEAEYNPDGTLGQTRPTDPVAPPEVLKRIVPVLPPPITNFIVPYLDVVHNRAAIEIQRGCTRGCRFCQAGMIFRPVRERPLAEVLKAVDAMIAATGFEEVSFLSLSSSDYTYIEELVRGVTEKHGSKKLSIGLPSLRIESFSVELMDMLEKGRRRSGFTFAPEAATDRLRDVINKPIPTRDLLNVAEQVYSRGWTTIKLYFMIGHPTQTMEDVVAIADLAKEVLKVGRRILGQRANVRVGVSTLVPKPHTPFQWVPLLEENEIREHISYLKRALNGSGLHLNTNNPRETLMEAFLSRGDRKLADVVERAWRLGARFDGWQEQFADYAWMQAFADFGLDPDWYARRARSTDEVLPWEHINAGLKKQFLVDEYRHTYEGAVVDDCREHCFSCGILTKFKEERRSLPQEAWGCPSLGRNVQRQPVSVMPIPLYFNEEMAPELAATSGPRVLQRAGYHDKEPSVA